MTVLFNISPTINFINNCYIISSETCLEQMLHCMNLSFISQAHRLFILDWHRVISYIICISHLCCLSCTLHTLSGKSGCLQNLHKPLVHCLAYCTTACSPTPHAGDHILLWFFLKSVIYSRVKKRQHMVRAVNKTVCISVDENVVVIVLNSVAVVILQDSPLLTSHCSSIQFCWKLKLLDFLDRLNMPVSRIL